MIVTAALSIGNDVTVDGGISWPLGATVAISDRNWLKDVE
jgi:hypothetical protein